MKVNEYIYIYIYIYVYIYQIIYLLLKEDCYRGIFSKSIKRIIFYKNTLWIVFLYTFY